MFGYISPDNPYLFKKDEILYGAMYCGLCKSIGACCGQLARTALTYDMAFVSALVHNIKNQDVKINKERCVAHWFRRRPTAGRDDTFSALASVNTVLAYYKLCDDKNDGDKRGILRHVYKNGYKKSLKSHPWSGAVISEYTAAQSALEKRGCSVIDEACEPTSQMMKELSKYLLGEYSTEYTERLFYALGKWVYLIDAVDDYDKDAKKGSYNALRAAYGANSFKEVRAAHDEELKFIFDSLFAEMRECLANIKFYFNHDLTDNIILRGIPVKTKNIYYRENYERKKS